MQDTSILVDSSENKSYRIFFIIFLVVFIGVAIAAMGVQGVLLSLFLLAGVIITPFIYNKPKLFLFFSLFIYPFTRILALEDKFIITGVLYTLSVPCAVWIIQKHFKKVSGFSFYVWPILFYTLVILLQIIRPGTSMIELLKDFGRNYYALFIILAVYDYITKTPVNLEKLGNYLSYAMNLIAVIGVGQYITKFGGMYNEGFYRIRGTFFNFNEYGFVISVFICFALYMLLTSNVMKERTYWAATIGINLVALILTLSKTSMLNTALIFFVMGMFLPWKRKLQLFATMIIGGSALFAFLVFSGNIENIIMRFNNTSSLDYRLQVWGTLYNLLLRGDIIFGNGVNASKVFLLGRLPARFSVAPHNVYLETLYNYGVVGIIPFVSIFLSTMLKGVKYFFFTKFSGNKPKMIGVSIVCISLIVMIQNTVSNAYYDRAGNVILWTILVLLVCQYRQFEAESIEKV